MLRSKNNSAEGKEELCRTMCKEKVVPEHKNDCFKNEDCHQRCLSTLGTSGLSTEVNSTILNENKSLEPTEKSFNEVNSVVNKNPSERSKKSYTATNVKDQSNKPSQHIERIPSIHEDNKEDEEFKYLSHCHEGKPCPLINLLVNRRKLKQTIKTAIESALNHKLSEILSNEITQKQDDLTSRLEDSGKENKNKPCSTNNSLLNKANNKNEPVQREKPFCTHISNVSRATKESEGSTKTSLQQRSQKSVQYLKSISSHAESNNSKIETKSKSSGAPSTKTNEMDMNQNGSVFMKSTDLSQKSNQHSTSTLSYKGNEEENELLKWKRNCEEGIFTLKSLVEKCEKDPDSVLATFKLSKYTDKISPEETTDNRKQLSLLEKTHGKKMGDPKYHLLMIDASTSIHKLDLKHKKFTKCKKPAESKQHRSSRKLEKKVPRDSISIQSAKAILKQPMNSFIASAPGNKSEETSQRASITPKVSEANVDKISSEETEIKSENISPRDSIQSQDSGVTEDVITKEKAYQTTAPQQLEEKSEETIPEVLQLPAQLEQSQQSPTPLEQSQQSPPQLEQSQQSLKPEPSLEKSPPSLQQSEQSLVKEQKPTTPVKEKKASIVFKDNIPSDMDDEKKQHAKRPSAVSWRALNTPSDSDSTASLEQVVKDATAKAESFRQNLDTKRQHSLLDIVKKRSTLEKTIEDTPKPPPPTPPKRKKFFNFKCRDKKKERVKEKEKQKEERQSESEEESDQEVEEKKPKHSSSIYIENYRRRNTSFIENPVFEKKKELNQFLNNI